MGAFKTLHDNRQIESVPSVKLAAPSSSMETTVYIEFSTGRVMSF